MPYLVHFNYRSKDVWVATGRYFVQQKAEQKDICYSKTGSSQWPLQTCKDMQMIDKAKKLWWELAPLRATDTAHFGVSSSTLLQQPNRSIFLHLHKVKITTSHGEQVMCQNREEIKGNKSDIFPPDKHRQTRSRELGRHPGSSRSQGTAPHSDACWGPAAAGSLRPVIQFHLLLLLPFFTIFGHPDPANITAAVLLAWLQEACVPRRWEQILCQVRSQTTKHTPPLE